MATTNRLLPILRSDLVARLLTRLLVGNVEENQRELARALGVSEPSLSAAARHVLDTGVVASVQRGRSVYLRANPQSPLYAPLCQLLLVSTGPALELGRALSTVPGITDAYIFGSWAARNTGIPGPPPGDIDVLVIGPDVQLGDVATACLQAGERLGRAVNPIIKRPTQWEEPDAFVRSLREGPLTRLDLDTQEGGTDGTDTAEEPRTSTGADSGWTSAFGL